MIAKLYAVAVVGIVLVAALARNDEDMLPANVAFAAIAFVAMFLIAREKRSR